MIESYLFPALSETILTFTILMLLVLGVVFKKQGQTISFILAPLCLLGVCFALYYTPSLRDITFNSHFINDSFSVLGKYVVSICALFALLNIRDHQSFFQIRHFEFPILLLAAVLGMFILLSAHSFLSMFMGLELQSLALYVLIGLQHREKHVTEAVIKYFVLGAVATGFILFGVSFIYGFLGTTSFAMLEQALITTPPMHYGFLLGVSLVICGLAFKLSAAPFHIWAPDVYQGTPYPIVLFIATAPKIALLSFFMRFLYNPMYQVLEKWQPIIIGIALFSMVFGAVATILQNNIRRFLAYASISSVGFSLIGVAIGTEDGLRASLFYTVLYIVAVLGFLTCIMILLRRGFSGDSLSDLKGLATEKPFISLSIAIFLLSMSGIPPFPGFLGKLFLLQALIGREHYIIALISVLSTVIAAYYYFNVLKIIFFDSAAAPFPPLLSANLSKNYSIILLSIAILFLMIFFPKILLDWAGLAASTLLYA